MHTDIEKISDDKEIKFGLRPLESIDAGWLVCMRNDEEVISNLHDPMMYSADATEQWIKNMPKGSLRWVIYHNPAPFFSLYPHIGIIRIDHFDTLNRNCYVGMDIDKQWRGKGLSKEIYKIVLDRLFRVYNMETIYLEVLATNERAIHIYKKLGFFYSGCFPRKILRNNKHIDSFIMSLTKESYYETDNSERKLS